MKSDDEPHKEEERLAESDAWREVEAREIETHRLKRAWKLGKLGAKVTGGFLKDRLKQKWSGEEDQASALHSAAKRNVEEMVMVMGQLKGAAMKLGQMLSADPDLIDPDFAQALSTLQRHAPPVPFKQIQEVVESRLGGPLTEFFSYFDPKPLGAASIGQVHHAVLTDGREVAVKVQYPGVRDSLDSDLKNIEGFLTLGRSLIPKQRAKGFMAELKSALIQETDYLAEAQKLRDFNEHFKAWDRVRIPRPVDAYCTPDILVMEFIKGVPFTTGVNALSTAEDRVSIIKVFIEVFVYMFHDLHRLHADPHPGNFLLDSDHRLVLLDFGCVRDFNPEVADGVLMCLARFWAGDPEGQKACLLRLGFGTTDQHSERSLAKLPSAEAIATHHELILAPMAHHERFNFSRWSVHDDLRAFLSKNMNFIHLIPPPELILYLRVIAGIKGTLSQIDTGVNIREIAEKCCERRGII